MTDEQSKEKQEFENSVEGDDAVSALYEAFEKEGVLGGQAELAKRVDHLEREVQTLKDLISRAIKVNSKATLTD